MDVDERKYSTHNRYTVERFPYGGNQGRPGKSRGEAKILPLELFKTLLVENPEFKIQITDDEISDRSKGDALAKFIFIVQTSWFITEFIARGIQGLYFTQLELTTLALASLNGVTPVLWWYKPLGAQTPVCLYLKKLPQESNTAVTQVGP